MDCYIERERADSGKLRPGESAYEYALRPRIESGDVVVDTWIPHAEMVKRAGEDGLAFPEAAAATWARLLGCDVTRLAAPPPTEPPPAVDPNEARKARVAAMLDQQAAAALSAGETVVATDVLAVMSEDGRARFIEARPNDYSAAELALAAMADEERARWSAPDPVGDAALDLEDASRSQPSWMEGT